MRLESAVEVEKNFLSKMFQLIVLGCILLGTAYALKRPRDSNLNLPPLVHYNIPVIGHTLSYLLNCEEFFVKCKEEYGDIFSLYVWGQTKTFVGREHAQEVLVKNDVFDMGQAFKRRIFPEGLKFLDISASDDPISPIKVLKDSVFSRLVFYNGRVQKSLRFATQKYIGDCDEQKTFNNMSDVITNIIAVPIANIIMGEEESKYEDVVATFSEFTIDAAKFLMVPPILDFIYPGLQNYINHILIKYKIFDPITKHRNILVKHVKNQIDKRLREKREYGDSWDRPNDVLQDFIESEWFDADNIDYDSIADKMSVFIFTSVHSTSNGCTEVFMNLVSHPEYIQELYEEQLEIHKRADENGILPFEALNDMKKLDSFVRESLRLIGHIAFLPHLPLSDYTFSNGLQIPKHQMVEIYVDDINRDELLHGPNPNSFEPFRHMDKNNSASKVNRGYVLFGGGKCACPGRYFAVNEIKFFLHNVILKYNLRTEGGKVEKLRIGPLAIPSKGRIIFEKRK